MHISQQRGVVYVHLIYISLTLEYWNREDAKLSNQFAAANP